MERKSHLQTDLVLNPRTHVLYVDDEPSILELVEIYFKTHGINVGTAKNADEAIELFKNNPIRVVISDSRMPGLKGVELYHILNEKFGFNGVFILVSGNFSHREEGELPEGVSFTISKPVDYDELALMIRKLLTQPL